MFCRRTIGPLLFLSLTLSSCRHSREGFASIAILPLEEDSADGTTNGFGEAAPHLLQWQLDGNRTVYAFAAANQNAADAQHAGRSLYGWYRRDGSGIEAHLTLQAADRTVSIQTFRGDAAGVLNAVARSIAADARVFRSSDDDSIRQFGQALAVHGPATAELVQSARTGGVPFVPEALALARMLIESGHPREAGELVAHAGAGFSAASALDRARQNYDLATAAGDPDAQRRSLSDVVRLAPLDPLSRRTLADLQFNARDWTQADANYVELTRMEPWDGIVFNQLGYVRMYLHDAAGARAALAEYARITPEQAANAADSLGEINWNFGDYAAAAANFLEASRGDIVVLRGNDTLKAALARFMQGNRPEADRLFQRYAAWRKSGGDALVPVRQAEWLYFTGRRGEAESALAAVAGRLQPDAQAVALAQLSFWALLDKRRDDGLDLARRAAALAKVQAVREAAAVCVFYASPSAPADEWTRRANRAFGDVILGSALALDGHDQQAVALLSKVLAATPPNEDGYVRGMLIRTYRMMGQGAAAKKLLWPMPLPFYSGDPIFDAAWVGDWEAADAPGTKSESALTARHGSFGVLSSRSSTRS